MIRVLTRNDALTRLSRVIVMTCVLNGPLWVCISILWIRSLWERATWASLVEGTSCWQDLNVPQLYIMLAQLPSGCTVTLVQLSFGCSGAGREHNFIWCSGQGLKVALCLQVDAALLGSLAADVKGYLSTRFSLKSNDRPHLMAF